MPVCHEQREEVGHRPSQVAKTNNKPRDPEARTVIEQNKKPTIEKCLCKDITLNYEF